MTHRVLQILDAIEEQIRTLDILEGRVTRSARPWDKAPSVSIRLANWQPLSEETSKVNAEAFVNIMITGAQTRTENADDQLLTVDAQIHQLLKADDTLGLPFVILSRRIGFPTDANAEGELPTGSAIAQWAFQFRYDADSME